MLTSGRIIDAKSLEPGDGDAIEVIRYSGRETFSPEQIRNIRVTNRARGLFEGFGIGLLGGVLGGGLLGYAGGDDEAGLIASTAEEKALVGALGLGAIGAVVGAALGLLIGSTDVYEYPGSRIQLAPTPGGAQAALGFRF